MNKLLGVLLIATGVASLWFGGIPYTTRETIVKLGPLESKMDRETVLEIPKPVSAGLVGFGVLLLLLPSGKKKK
jgi:hypothetical protein